MSTETSERFPEFQTVKQEILSDCGAAVAAMACGQTLKHAKSLMKSATHDGRPYYRTSEAAKYLATHGMLMGLHLEVRENPVRPAKALVIPWKMKGWAAILAVKSKRFEDADHWVLWDGQRVRDPNPEAGETSDLEDYEVLEIYPLSIVNDIGAMKAAEAASAEQPHVGNVDEAIKELRAAGLDAWDQVDDPEAELGRGET